MKNFFENFLDGSPEWYKFTILGFLILNPILLLTVGPFVTGWIIIIEFIFCLAMALNCYPLPAGGLIAIEAVVIGMASPAGVYMEVEHNFPILLLLMFMVAGIYFMRDLLLFVFTNILVRIGNKPTLAFVFAFMGAFLSAFLDALTVVAIVINVTQGFFQVYHRFASRRGEEDDHDPTNDDAVHHEWHAELEQFRAFLRSILMHAAVGTALGGVCTLVGEPQNVLIGHLMDWDFVTFFVKVAPVSIPVFFVGLGTCIILEKNKWFGYGATLPAQTRQVMMDFAQRQNNKRDQKGSLRLVVQAFAAVLLIVALATHVAEVGLIGLSVIVFLTAMNGITEEHRIGHAFTESLPFAALLVVFFAIVAMIHENHLFTPIIQWALHVEGKNQLLAFFAATGILSSISDNVFVASVYISEAKAAFDAGQMTREQFELIAVAINTGTNIPSVATPNGQAAFLFLLTSPIAGLIRLSYGRMFWMALPYTVTMTTTAVLAVWFFL
jgi:NhaB family Na+:H+ antiporter